MGIITLKLNFVFLVIYLPKKNITTKNYKLYYDQYLVNKNGHINGLSDDLDELFSNLSKQSNGIY